MVTHNCLWKTEVYFELSSKTWKDMFKTNKLFYGQTGMLKLLEATQFAITGKE